jgi:ABC-type amino acid transport substrate-binding protein
VSLIFWKSLNASFLPFFGRLSYFFSHCLLFSLLLNSPLVNAKTSLKLSETELTWIKAHPEITVANEIDWPPFDYTENGKPAGYSVDVIHLIAQKTGLKIKFVNGYTWLELMQQFQAGKIDVMPAIYANEERKTYSLFTRDYYSQPSVIVVNKNNKDIININSLTGKRVASIKGFSITKTLEETIPNVSIVPVNNVLEGLKAISLGNAEAFIDSIGTVSYTLENNYIPNIKIISNVDHEALANPSMHMAVYKNKPILLNILNKALASIDRDEKQILANRWFSVAKSENKNDTSEMFSLNPEQKSWLNEHSKIRIGIMNAWPPMDYTDSNGVAKGIGVEFIHALNKRLGNRLEIVPGEWEDIYRAVKEKKLDALMDITPRLDRETFFYFTRPYIKVPHLIFTRKGEPPVISLSDLNDKTIGVEKKFYIIEVLRKKYPKVKIKEYKNTSDALDALSKKEVYAYVGNRAVANYILENELITNVIPQGKITETSSINAIGVRNDWPILRDILQKGLDDITPHERSSIINFKPQKNKLDEMKATLFQSLTKAERDWLNKKQTLHLGVDSAWPPVEWINKKKKYQGITSDYIKILSEVLGLNIAKPEIMSWKDVLDKAKNGNLDILPAAVPTPERSKFLNFTLPYLNFPFVIFTRNDTRLVTNIKDFYGKRVGIEESYSSKQDLERDHPQLNLVAYNTTEDILYALSVGEIDAYIGNLTVAVYLINKNGLTNIKVAAPTSYSFDLSIGIPKNLPELFSIINKTLPLIDESQHDEIHQRWLKLKYEVGVDYTLVIRGAIFVTIIILLISLWLLFIQRQKRMLKESKAETELANSAYFAANEQLMLANTRLKEMDHMKSMFIASISHELRTPLNSIIGFSSMMMTSTFGDLNEKYQDYITRINRSGQHLLELITDIIDISKIEAGRVDIITESFLLDEVITETTESLLQQIKQKGLSLDIIAPDKIVMNTDKRRLYQCVLNVLSNAMKYTEHGRITLTVEEFDQNVIMKISDTGIGISKEDMSRLFVAFERMDSHLQVLAGGTGLGLYLTKKIVTDILKGDVSAESELGHGSTFWIKVPKSIAPASISILERDN